MSGIHHPYDINIIGEYNLLATMAVKPLLDELGIRILSCISGDAKYHEGIVAPRQSGHDGVLESDDQCRAQDGGTLRHSLLRSSFYGIAT